MLYEMYTGVQAFTGETPVSVALKQIRERPVLPRKLDPSLPKNIEQAILRCLEKNPADRFQSVDEVVLALEGAPLAPAKSKPFATRRRILTFFAAAAAVVVLRAAALYFFSGSGSDAFQLPIERFVLSNGLKVVLSVDHSSPTVTLSMSYKAGARDDPPDRLGLAHLVSHLLYQGSPNVARGEFLSTIQAVGGATDDNLVQDASLFWDTVPANQLELVLFLEADRMRALDFSQAGLDEARSTLNEERRTRVDNTPYGPARAALRQVAYDNPINQRFLYGSQEELAKVTIQEAADFHRKYYGPSNAALALVGDFDPKIARERIRHYFEPIPARPAPPEPDVREPGRSAESRRVIEDPSARAPVLMISWRVPPPSDPDWFALLTLCEVLAANDAARLQLALVRDSGVASTVGIDMEDNLAPDLLIALVLALPGKDLGQVESLFYKEIERVAREGVTPAEIDRAQTDALRIRALGMVTTTARGLALSRLLAVHDHPEGINDWERLARHATSDELRRVAAKYLTPANRSVLVVLPTGGKK
jgi:predicted Zn-dependent peptidase